jgi:hypothetical protein
MVGMVEEISIGFRLTKDDSWLTSTWRWFSMFATSSALRLSGSPYAATRAPTVGCGLPSVWLTSDLMTFATLHYPPCRQLARTGILVGFSLLAWLACAEGVPASAPLSVQASWGQHMVSDGQTLALTFDQALNDAGPWVLTVGETDVTHLFKPAGVDRLEGVWLNEASLAGEQTFKVMRATTPTEWHVVAAWPIFIEPAKLSVKAKGSVGLKGQPWSEWSGRAAPLVRPTYTDANSQLSISSDYQNDAFTSQTEWQFLGASARPEAVRYPLERQQASKPDLVSYSVQAKQASAWGNSTFSAGQITMDAHPLLAPAYANRGVMLAHAFDKRFDVSFGVQSGARVLGVKNLSGVEDEDSLFTSAKVGVELLPERAGGLRAELGWFKGHLKPSALLNVAPSPQQTQHSQGWGLRFLGNTEDGRLSGELGVATSRYRLSGSLNSAELADSGAKHAHSWSFSYQLLPAETVWQDLPVDVAISVREDRSPTLYRSLGGGPTGDYLGRELALNGSLGIVTWGYTTSISEDNVEKDPLMLQGLRRQRGLDVSLPTAKLPGLSAWMQDKADAVWWPQLTYNEMQTRAWGNPDFLSDWATVDDLENVNTVERKLGLAWRPAQWTVALSLLSTDQDNRQANFAAQDMRSRGLQLDTTWRVFTGLKLGFTASQSRQRLLDTGDKNTGRKLGFDVQWSLRPDLQLKGGWTHQQTLEAYGPTRKATDTLQLSLNGKTRLPDWRYTGLGSDRLQGLWFVRLATTDNRSESDIAYLNYVALVRSLQLGFSVAF